MADAPDPDDIVTVTQDGVTVEKRFTVDEFPVPAVKFVLSSETDEAVEVRLTDEIPESFDMEGIGFHPEYDGDGWTAYRDHRVEYERTIAPGEEVTTVYGVRLDDPGTGDRFLDEPTLESVAPDDDRATPDDVLGRETTQAVRDALAGEGELSEAKGEGEAAATTLDLADPTAPDDADHAEPEAEATLDLADPAESADDGGESEGGERVASASDEDIAIDIEGTEVSEEDADGDEGSGDEADEDEADSTADEAAAPRSLDDDLTPAVRAGEGAAVGTDPAPSAGADGETDEAKGATAVRGSVVAALAEEVRAGEVDDDDLAALRDALDAGVPRSVEVRIDRLQNRTEDLAAYADALEEFIDEEGTAREVLDGLDTETTALREDLDAVEDELDAAAEERDDLAAATGAHDERLSGVEADLTALEERVTTVDGDLDAVRASVEDVERSVEDLAGDTDDDLGSVRDTLDDVEATVADLEDELEDLRSFRERMREALGT